ncbi:MAG: glycosyltransferase family 4 protein [Bacteroidales bacterium]|nr:glycosyltransferase family 4 protein [Bacteroidales bacterium]
MVIIIRAKDIESDSRVLKYIHFLREKEINYQIISWDRINGSSYDENTIDFNYKSLYNEGGWSAVKGRLKWMYFVIKTLRRIVTDDKTVLHACDLDAAFPAVVFKTMFCRGVKVIFDIFDWFSATLSNQNHLIRRSFTLMERFCIRHSDYIIICEKERQNQIPYYINKDRLFILPNIPSFINKEFLHLDKELCFDNNLITLAYVGGFTTDRCLDELISIAETGTINLLIAGFGDSRLEERLSQLNLKNIKYFGKVQYERGLNIMYNADIIYAMYSKINPNHYFAAPNKYYEAMFLGKPIISTSGINMDSKIKSDNIGYITNEGQESINECFQSITRSDLIDKGLNSAKLWESKYKTYTIDFLTTQYLKLITSK